MPMASRDFYIDDIMKLTTCPICASRKIKVSTGAITFQAAKGVVSIPNVKREKCENCGEEFFDHVANVILDQYRGVLKGARRRKKNDQRQAALDRQPPTAPCVTLRASFSR